VVDRYAWRVTLPILYSFRRCPYAMRARLALRYAGVQVAVREVVLRDKPQALRDASPKATVPVLCLPDGKVLEQSIDIMIWALQQSDPEGWLTATDPAEQRALIERNDGPFKLLLDRYKYPKRTLVATRAEPDATLHAQRTYRGEALALHLNDLEQRLTRSRFLLAYRPALADMALVPFVRQFALVDAGWFDTGPLPALRQWLGVLTAAPLFEQIMVKLVPWQAGTREPVL